MPQILTQRCQRGIDDQGDKKEETDAEDHSEGEEALFDEGHDAAALFFLDVPDRVQRIFELAEDPRSAEEKNDHADDDSDSSSPGLRRADEHLLDRFRAGVSHQSPHLPDDLDLCLTPAKHQTGDGDGDQ